MAEWPGIYNTGTATVAANGTTVTFQSAGNLSQAVRPGDRFGAHKGLGVRIASISGNTATLAQPWPGAAQTAAPYEIAFTPFDSGYRQALQTLIDTIGGGNTGALNALVLAANQLLYVNDSGVIDQASLTAFARSILDDADAGTILSTLGVTAFAKTLLDDADASTALSTLGVSTFIKTLLDDANAAAARGTLGVADQGVIGAAGAAPVQTLRGTKSQNDAFTGPSGTLTVDLTSQEMRLHDGATPGGKQIGAGSSAVITAAQTSAAIQAAIDLAASHPSRTVALQGTYTLTSAVNMRPGVVLWCMPGAATLTVANGSALDKFINFSTYTAHGAVLDGVKIDGNRSNRADNYEHFLVYGWGSVDDVRVQNCKIVNATGFALYFRDFNRARIVNNDVDNCFMAGIYCKNVERLFLTEHLIEKNRVSKFGMHGIVTWNTSRSRILNNDCTGYGQKDTRVTISGTTITWVSGTNFANVKPGEFVIGNHSGGYFEAHILSKQSNTQLTVAASIGTYSNVPTNIGNGDVISISGSSDELIQGNRVTGGACLGISLFATGDSSCDRCRVVDNYVNNTLSAGYSIQIASGGNYVRDCIFMNNFAVDTGIGGDGSAASFRVGMGITGANAQRNVVMGNSWISYGQGMTAGLSIDVSVPSVLTGGNKHVGLPETIVNGTDVTLSGWGNATINNVETGDDTVFIELLRGSTAPSANPSITLVHRARPLRRKRASAIMTGSPAAVLPVTTFYPESESATAIIIGGTPGGSAESAFRFVVKL